MSRLLMLIAVVSLTACPPSRPDAPPEPGPDASASEAPSVPDGPGRKALDPSAFELTLEIMESAPPQYAVNVAATVPSGGYSWAGDPQVVKPTAEAEGTILLTLQGPPPDAMVTQAIETLTTRIPLGAEPRAGGVTVSVKQGEGEPVEVGSLSWP